LQSIREGIDLSHWVARLLRYAKEDFDQSALRRSDMNQRLVDRQEVFCAIGKAISAIDGERLQL
jgi:hypothetical protein